MAATKPSEVRLKDPLSDVTRRERRSLLAASVVGVTMVKTGLVPEKISALGVELSKVNQRSLLIVLASMTLYFLIAFILYASSDFLAWRLSLFESLGQIYVKRRKWITVKEAATDEDTLMDEFYRENKLRYFFLLSHPISLLRAVLDFLVPVVFGVYAVLILWAARVPVGAK